MLNLALIRDCHGFKALVRMSAHTALFIARWKLIRRGVVEQQERAQLTAKTIVIEHGARGSRCRPSAFPNSDGCEVIFS